MPFDYAPNFRFPNDITPQWSQVSSLLEENLWSRSAQQKLIELSKLPENWNGYGSRPVQRDALEIAANLLSSLAKLRMPEPQIFPVSGGGIQLEWENSKCELEIEILPNKTVEFLIVDDEREMREGQLSQSTDGIEIACLAHWFMSEQPSVNKLSSVYALASHG